MRVKIPTNIIVLLALCAVIAAVTIVFSNHTPASSEKKIISDFSYTDIHDKAGSLYQFKDRVIVVHFWATWCLPCIDELPELIDKAADQPDAQFILISADREKSHITRFLKPYEKKLSKNITVIHDPMLKIITGHFKVTQFPESIILNKDYMVQDHLVGVVPWDNIDLDQ